MAGYRSKRWYSCDVCPMVQGSTNVSLPRVAVFGAHGESRVTGVRRRRRPGPARRPVAALARFCAAPARARLNAAPSAWSPVCACPRVAFSASCPAHLCSARPPAARTRAAGGRAHVRSEIRAEELRLSGTRGAGCPRARKGASEPGAPRWQCSPISCCASAARAPAR